MNTTTKILIGIGTIGLAYLGWKWYQGRQAEASSPTGETSGGGGGGGLLSDIKEGIKEAGENIQAVFVPTPVAASQTPQQQQQVVITGTDSMLNVRPAASVSALTTPTASTRPNNAATFGSRPAATQTTGTFSSRPRPPKTFVATQLAAPSVAKPAVVTQTPVTVQK